MVNDSQKPSSNNPGRAEGLSLDNGLDYRIIFNATSNGMAFTEFGSGMIIDVNAAWIRSTGIVREKAIGRTAFELGLWASQAEREACYAELDKKGRIVDFEARLLMKSAELPHLISGEFIEMGGKRYVLWEFRDITDRKQAEELFRSLATNSPVGVYIAQQGKFVYTNPQFQRDSGYREDELLGMEALSLVFPEDREKVRNNAIQMHKGKRIVPYEFKAIHKNGEIKWALESVASIQHQGKQAIIGSYQDITERKRAEEVLHHSEAFLNNIIEQSPYAIWISDDKGTLLRLNQACRDLLHITDEEVIGKYNVLKDSIVEEQGLMPLVKQVFEQGKVVRFNLEYDSSKLAHLVLKNTVFVILDVTIFPIKDSSGQVTNAVIQHIDITERKLTSEAVRESQEKYRALIETTDTGYVIIDLTGKVLDANDEYVRLTGHERRDEILGRSIVEWTAAYDRERNAKAVEECVQHGFVRNFEVDYAGIQGQIIPVETNATLVDTKSGPQVLALCRDITDRKRAEENLQRIKIAVESAGDAIGMSTPQGVHFYHNQSFTDLVGYSIEELQKPLGPTILFADAMIAREVFETIMQGNSWRGEIMMVAKSGRQFPVTFRANAIKDDKGNIIGLIGIFSDITERKRAEEVLRQSEISYRTIFDSATDAIFLHDAETGRILEVNEAACHLWGYSREEFQASTPGMLSSGIPPYTQKEAMEWVRRAVKEGPQSFYWIAKRRDGTPIWFENSLKHIDIGGEKRVLVVGRDITDRKRAEEKIKRLANENAIIAEIGRVISSTLKIEEMYGRFAAEVKKLIPYDRIMFSNIDLKYQMLTLDYVSGHEVPDRRQGDHLPLAGSITDDLTKRRAGIFFQADKEEECAERFLALVSTFRAGLRSFISVPLLSKDELIGAFYLQSLTPHAYTEEDLKLAEKVGNQIAGAIANAQLFAEHERSEAEKANLQTQLQQSQKMEAIGRLAGGVAHDFNNLLTVISVQAQLALRGLKEGDPLKEKLKDIELAADRAANLTRQLLAFSRRQILEMKVVNLNIILTDMEKMLRRVIGEDLDLKTILADDLGMVKVDPGQMEQVIVNLAVNAKDAMPKGGKLILETANAELDEEYPRSHVGMIPGAYVMLSITDTGTGMTKEVREQIFDPFFTTKEKDKGTGLGLSTVYGIVKQSGGDIYVYSEPNQGTTFKVYLPRVFEPPEDFKKVTREEIFLGKETILIVEDDRMVRRLAVDILRRQGYRILEATEGGEALVMCEKEKEAIDLILSDIVMPHMSGPELIERLKKVRTDFKVLYMTGYTDESIVQQGILEEGIELIHKPFTIQKLSRKVREVLDNN